MKLCFAIFILTFLGCSEPPTQEISREVAGGNLLFGKVISITDGDTITIKDVKNEEYRIRLGEIDAPEKSQEYGAESTQVLKDLVLDKQVKIFWKKKDHFSWKTSDHQVKIGRIIGGVYIDDRFINRELVEQGAAWHYKEFSKDETLPVAEDYAKEHKYGLWAKPNPISPWNYRKRKN